MQHPDFVFWSFIGFILAILPAPWHWRARNIATLSLIFWAGLVNLTVFVNAIVWADNYRNPAPVWCDISSRILLAVSVAIPASSLAQMRRLESVASARQTIVTASQQSRRMWGEAFLCFALPILMLPIDYISQGHRFDIAEATGCQATLFYSWPALVSRFIIPLVISFASFVYAALAVRWFLLRRLQFRSILAKSDSGLNVSRYLRLIALAVCDVSILVCINGFAIGITLRQTGLSPYKSWHRVHADFSIVSQYPEALNTNINNVISVVSLYAGPLYSIVFFAFFGLGEEAVADYAAIWTRLRDALSYFGWTINRRISVHMSNPPALGSKVVSTSGLPWSEEMQSPAPEGETLSAEWNTKPLPSRARIAVQVERSIA